METGNLKLDLVKLIISTDDEGLLLQAKALLSSSNSYVVPESHQQIVQERREQYSTSQQEGFTFEQLEAKIRKRK